VRTVRNPFRESPDSCRPPARKARRDTDGSSTPLGARRTIQVRVSLAIGAACVTVPSLAAPGQAPLLRKCTVQGIEARCGSLAVPRIATGRRETDPAPGRRLGTTGIAVNALIAAYVAVTTVTNLLLG
jgi:hypothetical protein